ncbi:MAG: homocysteine S-methyltransferase family protein, partial [Bdellovibrionales bacterium]|nr:homocysteine S-methyltransferase family protein [Bdellovibrionales bacterium]
MRLTPERRQRIDLLKETLSKRVLVLDGAMGTSIQELDLTAQDFGGEDFEGCNEYLNLVHPTSIQKVHDDFVKAGADIIETNTFGGTPVVLDEYGLGNQAIEINLAAAKLARDAARRESSRPIWVAGSIGPTTKAISVTGGITFDELIENFYVQSKALHEGEVDYFLIETAQDTRNIKAALLAIHKLYETHEPIPIAVSGTIEPMGTMLAGQSVDALTVSLLHENLLYIGLNCATGPEFMTDHIRTLNYYSPWPIACVPNAGLPDENGKYIESPEMMGKILLNFGKNKWLNLIGGCCGTTPDHIAEFVKVAKQVPPRTDFHPRGSLLSGLETLEVTDEKRPLIVGERTNVIGSRKFKKLVVSEDFVQASEVARAQVKAGAHIIDICLSNPDRDELKDIDSFMSEVIKKVKVPLMIDSTDRVVIERALTYSQGKSIINSINLEDGEERFESIVPLGKKYGAAFVVGTIDEDPNQGMGVSRERKLQIARRSYDLLTNKYGVLPEDIYFDPLVFPCGTGDEQYKGSARETIEGLRLIKKEFPLCKTVLGISNVSFGLPASGREVLNSVFLYHCTQAGLDLAIVNSQSLLRFATIDESDKLICMNLIDNLGEDPIAEFAAHFRDRKAEPEKSKKDLPIEERLAQYIIEGSQDGLVPDLDEMLITMKPLEIINGPLMNGMDEVGRLFNNNELIVAEVLQSAESMKRAVTHLEQFIEKTESASRGKMILATVKGDVHDIGKNLVDIILSNNGFEVVNLGIKVSPEVLISAVREHEPDFIGLSGLLVKSAQQMVVTASDLKSSGINIPILVGGAALSQRFVDKNISKQYDGLVDYAQDAMQGLELAKKIVTEEGRNAYLETVRDRQSRTQELTTQEKSSFEATESRSAEVRILDTFPKPTDYERHILTKTPIENIWSFINPLMLYSRHLGIKGQHIKKILSGSIQDLKGDPHAEKAYEIYSAVETVKKSYRNRLFPKAVYQFFKAQGEKNQIHLFHPNDIPLATLEFPRQPREDGLCLSDYVQPVQGKPANSIGLFVVTCGAGIRDTATSLIKEGRYL